MAIKVKSYRISEGWHRARLVDMYPEYDVATEYGLKDYVWFVFALEDGKEIKRRYGLTFHKNGFLYPIVRGLLQAEPNEDTDLEELIGMECEIEVKHKTGSKGKIWANVVNARRIYVLD